MANLKFYKYSLLTNLILCGGLFIPIVGQIDSSKNRYLLYDIFHAPAFYIKELVDWKFSTAEELATWNSYMYVGPLLNLISSSFWTLLILSILRLVQTSATINTEKNNFWKSAFKLNTFITLLLFFLWLPMSNFFIRGVSDNILGDLQLLLWLPLQFFGLVTTIVGRIFLQSGGDTPFGFRDTELISKLASSFGVTAMTILIIHLKFRISRGKSMQPTKA